MGSSRAKLSRNNENSSLFVIQTDKNGNQKKLLPNHSGCVSGNGCHDSGLSLASDCHRSPRCLASALCWLASCSCRVASSLCWLACSSRLECIPGLYKLQNLILPCLLL